MNKKPITDAQRAKYLKVQKTLDAKIEKFRQARWVMESYFEKIKPHDSYNSPVWHKYCEATGTDFSTNLGDMTC